MPGKGLGVVATRLLEPGEKIMAEIPILRGTTDDLKQQSYMNSVLAQLSNTKRKKFQKLYNAFPEQDDVGIVRTNSFALGCNTDLAGVFDKLSRLNHSCRPNSERWWDPEQDVETLYALRRIEANEEITGLHGRRGSFWVFQGPDML